MSTKQMAQAAVRERRLTFHFEKGAAIQGYLVGMDDYHWLVAQPEADLDNPDLQHVETHLVHKGSVPRVRISRTTSLSDEPAEVQAEVRSVGASFLAYCHTLLGRAPSTPATA